MSDELPPHRPVRVVIVEADRRVRDGLVGLFAISDQVEVAGSASHPGAALELLRRTRPDVVIVDPRLPDVDAGLALLPLLRDLADGARILVMNWLDSLTEAFRTAGADGFLDLCAPPAALVEAVVAGSAASSPSVHLADGQDGRRLRTGC